MKKFLCLTVVGAMLFAGCSNSNGGQNNGSSQQEQSQQQSNEQPSENEQQPNVEVSEEGQRLLELSDKLPQFEEVKSGDTVATFKTSMGEFKVKLFPEEAPKAVENFVTHAQDGYYNGVVFHRVIKDFMNQSGDPEGTGMGGESIWGSSFEDEPSPYLYQFRGALSMANTGLPTTNGSQFFIVTAPTVDMEYFSSLDEFLKDFGTDELLKDQNGRITRTTYPEIAREKYNEVGGTPWLDYGHTVFGQVIEGMEIVDTMNGVETIDPAAQNDRPVEDIVIEGIEITTVE